MTSSNGNIFRVTGPLWGEYTGHWWIPLTKASDAKFDVSFDLRLNKRLIWDAIALIMTSLQCGVQKGQGIINKACRTGDC